MQSTSAVSHILLSWISVPHSSLDRRREMTSYPSYVRWTSVNPPRSCELRSCVALWHEQYCTYWSVTVVGQPARLEQVGGERVPALWDYPPTHPHSFPTPPQLSEGRDQSPELQIVIDTLNARRSLVTNTEGKRPLLELVGDVRNVINTGHSAQGKMVRTEKKVDGLGKRTFFMEFMAEKGNWNNGPADPVFQ